MKTCLITQNLDDLKFISTWDLLMANNKWMQEAADEWGNSSFLMYVQLQPNTTHEAVSAVIKNAEHDKVERRR